MPEWLEPILRWLQDTYKCEVVTFTADIGQGEELEPARSKAKAAGVKEIFIDDLREEFVRDFVYPMFRANAIYEGEYLLGTSIARPLIAKRQIEIAEQVLHVQGWGAWPVCSKKLSLADHTKLLHTVRPGETLAAVARD